MAIVLAGANINIYINNALFKTAQSFSFSVDYGETEIYGIDSPYAQEIAGTKVTVRGSISGLRVKNSGGLQAQNLRPIFTDMAASPYISIRIQDKKSAEDIIFIQQAKVIRESHSAATKGTYKLSFDFAGIIPLFALDRSDNAGLGGALNAASNAIGNLI